MIGRLTNSLGWLYQELGDFRRSSELNRESQEMGHRAKNQNVELSAIINVASGAVRLGRPNYLHYIATKAALAGMSLSMARELGSDGITVNAILPGATFTEIERKTVTPAQKEGIIAMQCVPRAEVPEDLVGAVLFLASEASAFVTGQSINLDGGVTGS